MVSMEEQKRRRTRRKFTDEYKARAVRLVLKEGQTAAQVARDLDLIESVLHSCPSRGCSSIPTAARSTRATTTNEP
jgi:transposase-like protein